MKDNTDNLLRKAIVNQDDFLIKKKYSQNFLLDKNIISKIIENAEIDQTTGVIEIGPGLGALTKSIADKAKKVLIYEIDRDLIPYLESFLRGYHNYTLLNTDILKANICEDIKNHLSDVDQIVVISNLPYHITTPIIMRFLEEVSGINRMVLMMQLEVAQRITSKPDTKDYNALSVVIQHQATARYLFKVPKTVFHPQPNVDSAVIRLDIKKDVNAMDNKLFYQFVHQCFAQRRKTLVNNITNGYNKYTKEELNQILIENKLNPLARAESLSLDELLNLYETYYKTQ